MGSEMVREDGNGKKREQCTSVRKNYFLPEFLKEMDSFSSKSQEFIKQAR